MLYQNVNLESFGYELPPEVISSAEIETRLQPVYQRLKLPKGRLELMSGIRERRFWKPGTMPSDGAILAGRKALAAAGIPKEKIGCLIMCSVSRDFLEPATATVVHQALDLPENMLVFDVSNACLGILTGILLVANMIELGQIEAGILVAGENSRPLVESTIKALLEDKSLTRNSIKPYFASLTIGSGAASIVLAHRQISQSGHRLLGGHSMAVTSHNRLCQGNADKGMGDNEETLMNTDAEQLMQHGIATAAGTWQQFQQELDWDHNSPDCVCTHQVGSAHRKLLYETLGLDPQRDFPTLEILGNVGSVSCPITTAIAAEQGKVSHGEKLAMLGIGSGIVCTMLGLEW